MQHRISRILLAMVLLGRLTVMGEISPAPNQPFVVKGNIKNLPDGSVIYLQYDQAGKFIRDSSTVKDGWFEFKGAVDRPTQASLYARQSSPKDVFGTSRRGLYLQQGTITLKSSNLLDSATVTGSAETKIADEWKHREEELVAQRNDLHLRRYYNRGNKDSVHILDEKMQQWDLEFDRVMAAFVAKYPDSYVSWDLVYESRIGMDPLRMEPLLKAIGTRFRQSPEGVALAAQLEQVKLVVIGVKSPGFVQTGVQGQPVTLSSFRGKYVLVDFWASWCGICRAENPNVLKAYNAYKERGFTVLGVSLDDSAHKNAWLQAIKEDGMPWQQVSDLKGRDNSAAILYGIKGIPQNVLIGPDGVIVAKNLRDRELMAKLMDIFDGDKNMKLEGHINGLNDRQAVFTYYAGNKLVQDTVAIHNGDLTWLTVMPEPQRVEAELLPSGRKLRFYSDIGYLTLTGSADAMDSVKLKGSWLDDEAKHFQASLKNTTGMKRQEQIVSYIEAHPMSLYSLSLIGELMQQDRQQARSLYAGLDAPVRTTSGGRRIGAELAQ